jgi:hypothetical protein
VDTTEVSNSTRGPACAARAVLVLACIAVLPLLFTAVEHGDCYGGSPVLLESVRWGGADGTGDCCAELRTTPRSRLTRSLLGAELLGFLFAPIAVGYARIVGLARGREPAVAVAAVVLVHLATLGLGERLIGGAFATIGTGALMLAPVTYVPAWLATRRFARVGQDAREPAQPSTERRPALLAVALAAAAVPAWLFLAVANPPPDGARSPASLVGSGCSAR